MKHHRHTTMLFVALLAFSHVIVAQSDENRQASGLPTAISGGAGITMVVSGRVDIEGVEMLERKPIVTVIVFVNGVPYARTVARDSGHYTLGNVPRNDATLVIEVDEFEVSRQYLVASAMGNLTIDLTIPNSLVKVTTKPGVISARTGFERSGKNAQLFADAMSALKENDSSKAVKLFDELLAAEPKDYEAWTELGTIYFKTKSSGNAEKAYLKAIEIKKDYFVALLNLGKLYVSDQKWENAIIALSNAVKAKEDSADAHHFLGESYLQIKKGSLAVVELNQAIKLAPDEKAELHLRLAALYDAANLRSRAAEEYKLFIAKRPDYKDKAKLEKYIANNSAQ